MSDSPPPTLGERVRQWRLRRNLSQRNLATKAHLGPSTVANIERGAVARPQFDTVAKLAEALGVDPSELRGNDPLR